VNCSYDTGPDDGTYAQLVAQTNGVKEEICTPNWSTTIEKLSEFAFGFRTNFFLTSTPDPSRGPIEVAIDNRPIPSTDSRGAAAWAYDPLANSVNFQPMYVPEPGQTLAISYPTTCYQ
jgi:hypothetical protein